MTTAVKHILDEFEHLAESDKQELATEVLRRTLQMDLQPLSDDQLLQIADELFLELDREEREA